MPLKLKLKVNSSKKPAAKTESDSSEVKPLPRLKIKHGSVKSESLGGVQKPKPAKEKLKKLKISLGKPSSASPATEQNPHKPNGHVQPILKKVPKVRIKPTRVPGEGYDSEAPDVEDDPLLEQAIAVRFLDDANLDFLHSAADTGDFSNVNIKWITRDKAVVNVNSTLYSARLVDLPTLTELYKTVDKKNIFKTIDVSQILLVLRTINPKLLNMDSDFEVPEEYTYTHPLFKLSAHKEIRPSRTAYRHGLSNSFEDVYRRFRPKKVNHRVMTDVESRVDEIIRRDNDAQESHYEYVNPRSQPQRLAESGRPQDLLQRSASGASIIQSQSSPLAMGQGSIGGQDTFADAEDEAGDQMALDLEADLDVALEQELADALDSTSNNAAATVLMKSEYGNEEDNDDEDAEDDDDDEDEDDANEGAVTGPNDDEEGDEDDDDDDEEDDDEDEDDDVKQDKSRAKKLEEEISDLQSAADKQKVLLAKASHKMMRMKFQSAYNNLKAQLDSKKRELAKIREQQSKQQVSGSKEGPFLRGNEDEDNEDDDDDDLEDDDDDEAANLQTTANLKEHEIIEDTRQPFYEDKAQGEGMSEANDANEEENYDDFQGLF